MNPGLNLHYVDKNQLLELQSHFLLTIFSKFLANI